MFPKNKKFHSGVTLMELVVVIAIIGIMSMVGIAAWQSSKKGSYLKNSQREVASAIKAAQSYALQGKTQDLSGEIRVPESYGVRFVDSDTYQIFYTDGPSSETYQEFNLNNGVSADSGGQTIISFNVPFASKSVNVSTITFQLSGDSKQLQVSDFMQEL